MGNVKLAHSICWEQNRHASFQESQPILLNVSNLPLQNKHVIIITIIKIVIVLRVNIKTHVKINIIK